MSDTTGDTPPAGGNKDAAGDGNKGDAAPTGPKLQEDEETYCSVTITHGFGYFWTWRQRVWQNTAYLSTFYDLLGKFGLNCGL